MSDVLSMSTMSSLAFESTDGRSDDLPDTVSVVPTNIPGLKCTGKFFNIHPYLPLAEQVEGPAFIKFMGQEQAEWLAEADLAHEITHLARIISQDKQRAKESLTKWVVPCVTQPDQWTSDIIKSQTKQSCQDWGITHAQGNHIDLTAVDKVVDADHAFPAVEVEPQRNGTQPPSPSGVTYEKKKQLRKRQKERRYIKKIGREIEEAYARQEAAVTAKSAAELAAKRATLPPKKTVLEPFFTLFPNLPTELRLQIWREHLKEQRIPRIYMDTKRIDRGRPVKTFKASTPPPSILHTCRESRIIALKYMRPFMATKHSQPCIYMIPHIDRLFVDIRCRQDMDDFEELIHNSDRRKIQILQMPMHAWMDTHGDEFTDFIYGFKKLQFVVLECAEGDELDTEEELWTGFPGECAKLIIETLVYKKKEDSTWKIPKTKIVKIEEGKRRPPLELMKKEWDGKKWMYWDPESQPKLSKLKSQSINKKLQGW